MGAGALGKAVEASSVEDIKGALKGLSPEDLSKLKGAMGVGGGAAEASAATGAMAKVFIIGAPSGNNLNSHLADKVAEKTGGKVVDFASAAGAGATLDKAGCEANLKKACDGAGDKIVLKNYMGVHCDDKDLFDAIAVVGTIKKVIFAFAGDELMRLCDMDVTDEVATKRSHFAWAEENGLPTLKVPATAADADTTAFATRTADSLGTMAEVFVIGAPSGNNLNSYLADKVAEKTGGKVVDFASAAGAGATLDKAGCEANLKKACDGAGDKIVLKNYMGVHCDDKDLFDALMVVGTVNKVIFAFAGDELKRLCDMDVNDEVATKRSHFTWAEENGLPTLKVPATGADADTAAFAARTVDSLIGA